MTQAFNTTSSMGRLTLNMLLSFAQFEREVTSERIRDKVAASKAKGMWMGGTPPLGYRCEQRSLVIVSAEAERVRHMFDRYLELGSVSRLVTELNQAGVRSKVYVAGQGREGRSVAFQFASLIKILRNPTYLGEVHHKGVRYPGQHEAIVARSVWEAVQILLNSRPPRGAGAGVHDAEFVLKALVFDQRGQPVKLAQTEKASGQAYRYYQTSGGEGAELIRARADKIEEAVEQVIVERLSRSQRLGWRKLPLAKRVRRIRQIVRRVEIEPKGVLLTLDTRKLDLTAPPRKRGRPNRLDPGPIIKIAIPMKFAPRAFAAVLTPSSCDSATNRAAPDRALVAAVAKAHSWRAQIEGGKTETLDALAKAHKMSAEEVERLLPLAYLSPAATSAVLEGRQGSTVTLDELLSIATARSWEDQARSLLL